MSLSNLAALVRLIIPSTPKMGIQGEGMIRAGKQKDKKLNLFRVKTQL